MIELNSFANIWKDVSDAGLGLHREDLDCGEIILEQRGGLGRLIDPGKRQATSVMRYFVVAGRRGRGCDVASNFSGAQLPAGKWVPLTFAEGAPRDA